MNESRREVTVNVKFKWTGSLFLSSIAVFAAFTIVCDGVLGPPPLPFSGVWDSWVFIAEPINGMVLGPLPGFLSSIIGVFAGHSISFRGTPEYIFSLGMPIGAAVSGLIFEGKWKIPIMYYSALLAAFFATPVSWELPAWGMWDIYLAFVLLLASVPIMTKDGAVWRSGSAKSKLVLAVLVSAFVGLEADVLFRIFILVPCQTYRVVFYSMEVVDLQYIWTIGAVETSIKAILSSIVSATVVPSIINVVRKLGSNSATPG